MKYTKQERYDRGYEYPYQSRFGYYSDSQSRNKITKRRRNNKQARKSNQINRTTP